MCDPVSIGIGILIGAGTGAAGAAITGGDVLQGALFGGVLGGIGGGFGGLGLGSIADVAGSTLTQGLVGSVTSGVTVSGIVGATAIGLGTSIVGGLLTNNQYEAAPNTIQNSAETFGPAAIQQAVNSGNPNVVSGSGGRRAGEVLILVPLGHPLDYNYRLHNIW